MSTSVMSTSVILRRRSAFTLVEMLVVVAVIGLLAAISIPFGAMMLERSRGVTCLSNLRQIGLGILSYTGDNRGLLPWSTSYSQIKNPSGPPTVIDLDFPDFIDTYLAKGNTTDSKARIVYTCPQARLITRIIQWPLTYSGNISALGSAYLNTNQAIPQSTYNSIRMGNICRPSEVITVADAAQGNGAGTVKGGMPYSDFYQLADASKSESLLDSLPVWNAQLNNDIIPGNTVGIYKLRYRHQRNTSGAASFADGHAERITADQMRFRNFAINY